MAGTGRCLRQAVGAPAARDPRGKRRVPAGGRTVTGRAEDDDRLVSEIMNGPNRRHLVAAAQTIAAVERVDRANSVEAREQAAADAAAAWSRFNDGSQMIDIDAARAFDHAKQEIGAAAMVDLDEIGREALDTPFGKALALAIVP